MQEFLIHVITAVAATAAGTFAIVGVFFLFWLKGGHNRIGPEGGQRDGRALLNLSNYGSSEISVSFGDIDNKESDLKKNSSFGSGLSTESHDDEPSLTEEVTEELQTYPPVSTITPPGKPPAPAPPPSTLPQTPSPPPLCPCPAPPPSSSSCPPPPPNMARPPPAPPKALPGGPPFLRGRIGSGDETHGQSGAVKPKLKPFFWDKVMANPDQAMVWNEISSGSFVFNEEMIEALFGYSDASKQMMNRKKNSSSETQFLQIIDNRKAQNLSILLRALNSTTKEVVDAIRSGNELPVELLQTLLKMAPTDEEELKLRLFPGDVSQLGPAEQFLKVLVDVPFAFQRIESMIFMTSLQEEVSSLKESFATLEVACNELKNSRLFLKLLEAVLKTGNRMNDGTFRGHAQAFKLDTLLKLSDVKGTDGKTTLLHFVVQEIIRSEGIRAVRTARSAQSPPSVKHTDLIDDSSPNTEEHYCSLGLNVVSGLSSELEDVKKAAVIDTDSLKSIILRLNLSLTKAKEFFNKEVKDMEEDSEFGSSLCSFIERADLDIKFLTEEEKRISALVKNTVDYFHGNAGKEEGLRLFVIVRDFLVMLDKSCKEVRETTMNAAKVSKKETKVVSSCPTSPQPCLDFQQRFSSAIAELRMYSSSSEEDSLSP